MDRFRPLVPHAARCATSARPGGRGLLPVPAAPHEPRPRRRRPRLRHPARAAGRRAGRLPAPRLRDRCRQPAPGLSVALQPCGDLHARRRQVRRREPGVPAHLHALRRHGVVGAVDLGRRAGAAPAVSEAVRAQKRY